MLGLRYFACERCEAVSGAPEMPPWCEDCESETFYEITDDLRDGSYFHSRSVHDDTE